MYIFLMICLLKKAFKYVTSVKSSKSKAILSSVTPKEQSIHNFQGENRFVPRNKGNEMMKGSLFPAVCWANALKANL